MIYKNKYITLFILLVFLLNTELIAQSEKTTAQNKSSTTLKVSQQPNNVIPTATKVASDSKDEEKIVVHKTMNVNQQPSNITPTATKLASDNDNNEEKVVVRKTMTVSQQPSNATSTATKTDIDKKAKLKDK